jgi:hypothetical protein
MYRTVISPAVVALLLLACNAEAQVTARAFSNGGVATANAQGIGNTRLHADASATNGGRAHANIRGSGLYGGYAQGLSVAASNGGFARSDVTSDARGWRARSYGESIAATNYGIAISQGNAIARGNSRAIGRSSAFSDFGDARSRADAEAYARRGGLSVAESDSVADALYGTAVSRSRARARSDFGGTAVSRGRAIGLGWGRRARARAFADSQAYYGGFSNASTYHLDP